MLIAFEGLDNVGKTSLASKVYSNLYYELPIEKVVIVKEPGVKLSNNLVDSINNESMDYLLSLTPTIAAQTTYQSITEQLASISPIKTRSKEECQYLNTLFDVALSLSVEALNDLKEGLGFEPIILRDRYTASAYAYQVIGNDLFEYKDILDKYREPDLWVYIQGDQFDRLDPQPTDATYSREYMTKVDKAYNEFFSSRDNVLHINNANGIYENSIIVTDKIINMYENGFAKSDRNKNDNE